MPLFEAILLEEAFEVSIHSNVSDDMLAMTSLAPVIDSVGQDYTRSMRLPWSDVGNVDEPIHQKWTTR